MPKEVCETMRRIAFGLVGIFLLLPSFGEATVAIRLDPQALASRSQVVVEGSVESLESHLSPDGKQIVTTVRIHVRSPWKGAPGEAVEVLVPGGAVGELAQVVQGAPSFVEGEDVVVFLDRPRPDVLFQVVGLAQGKFSVREEAGRQVAVQDLRNLELVDQETRRPAPPALDGPIPLEALRSEVAKAPRGE